MTSENVESTLKELLKTDSEMGNLIEFLNQTFLNKENIKTLFKLFLEVCKEYPLKCKKEPSLLLKLNRVLIIILHMESHTKKGQSSLVQLVMDDFDPLLEVLCVDEACSKLMVEGGTERRVYGLPRVEVLRLIHHCFMVNQKNFNLMVSMSKFGETLMALMNCFADNERFLASLLDVVELVLQTNHKPLISNLLGSERIVFLVNKMQVAKKKNNFVILKLLRLVDIKFDEKCLLVLEWESQKKENTQNEETKSVAQTFLEELQSDETFEIFQIKVYPSLKESIKIYFELEKEIKDRNNRRMSGSSIFSNNLIDDLDITDKLEKLPTSVDSDEKNDLEELNEEDFNDDDNDGRDSYGGIVRRRKMSEDNIKVGKGRNRGFGNELM
jgi:hypothetical protein